MEQRTLRLAVVMKRTLLFLAATAAASSCWSLPNYKVTNIGYLPGSTLGIAVPVQMNELGHCVGFGTTTGYIDHPWFWSPATGIIDLGTLEGTEEGTAEDVNDRNEVVGECYLEGFAPRGFIWSPATGMTEIQSPLGRFVEIYARSINNHSVVVGDMNFNGTWHPFRWSRENGFEDLAPIMGLPGLGFVGSINDAGQISGTYQAPDGSMRAYRWQPGRFEDLGNSFPQATNTYGNRLSPNGLMGGRSDMPDGSWVGLVWRQDGTVSEVGDLPGGPVVSFVNAVNDFSETVGFSMDADSLRGIYWSPSTGTRRLDSLLEPRSRGYSIFEGHDINRKHQIACAYQRNGYQRACLLTLVPSVTLK